MLTHSQSNRFSWRRNAAFSLIELLVVIAIIAVLAGMLLVALNVARNSGLRSATVTTMQSFIQAAETFRQEHGQYPGVIPDRLLAAMEEEPITGTENALLHLMGGYRLMVTPDDSGTPTATEFSEFRSNAVATGQPIHITFPDGGKVWQLVIDVNRIGEGPVIRGRSYPAYYTPDEGQMLVAQGQATSVDGDEPVDDYKLPDLVDSWGQPILYARRQRPDGPLAGVHAPTESPQFIFNETTEMPVGFWGYLRSIDLGEIGADQITENQGSESSGGGGASRAYSVMSRAPSEGIATALVIFEALAGNPSLEQTARGGLVLFSAGPDGVYYSAVDGPGASNKAVGSQRYRWADFIMDIEEKPELMDEYDDIRVFGGS